MTDQRSRDVLPIPDRPLPRLAHRTCWSSCSTQTSPMRPFDAWSTGGSGFEYFYGFIGGETNQYYPALYEGTPPVEPQKTPEEGYHFTEDLADKRLRVAMARQ